MATFLDNASVAAVLAVLLGAYFGQKIYRRQKRVDRLYSAQEELGKALFLMLEHCKAVNQAIDRLAYTYQITVHEKGDPDSIERFKSESVPAEIAIAAEILSLKLPEDASRAESIVSLYFSENNEIELALKDALEELKKWHDFVMNAAIGRKGKGLDLEKRVKDVKELSLNPLDQSIRKLFKVAELDN